MKDAMVDIRVKITPEHAEELTSLIGGNEVTLKRFLDDYGLRSISDLPERYFEESRGRIKLIHEIRQKGENIVKHAQGGPKKPVY
jgi:hypothetical protein